MARKKEKKADIFAQIAAQQIRHRGAEIKELAPPRLPRRFLPPPQSAPAAAFRPAEEIDTPEKLRRALERERRRTEKFLRNLAPALPSLRVVVPLESFDWRLGTPADAAEESRVFRGEGEWKRVKIPHYDGPIGRATTYYRTTFQAGKELLASECVSVCFRGADYKAHVFCNGNYLGSHEGFFAPFEFDATASLREGENTIVVRLENDAIMMGNDSWQPPGEETEWGDKLYAATGPGYDEPVTGWHHCPPGMGLYQDVWIEGRSAMHIHDVFVRPLPEENRAEAWVEINSRHRVRKPLRLELSVFGRNFPGTVFRDRPFEVAPAGPWRNEYRLSFDLPRVRLWEPEEPWLYQIQVKLRDETGRLLDVAERQFGMRSFRMDENSRPRGRLYLNGREIRLRGANTMGHMQQCVIHRRWEQLRDDILLCKLANLNFFRLTQRPVQPEIYEYCSRLGMMTQTDLPLFGVVRRSRFCEIVRQAEEMERLVRVHPCNVIVSYINEPFPDASGEPHRFLRRDEMESLFAAVDAAVRLANPDRVIKAVDGDYDPPAPGLPDNHCYNIWYNGHGVQLGKLHKGYWLPVKPGWMVGCGEFGAEGLDTVEVMRKYYPPEWLPQTPEEEKTWSPSAIPQAQSGDFHFMWYETPHSLAEWSQASRAHQAWGVRLMTEAFRRRSNMNTFAVHLGIDAFPSGWMKAVMDVDRVPKPAWFALRKACAPLNVHWRTDRFAFFAGETMALEAWVCNDRHEIPRGARLCYQLEVDGQVVCAGRTEAKILACDAAFQGFVRFAAPRVDRRTTVIARVALAARDGHVLHDSAVELEIFPPVSFASRRRAYLFGPRDGQAATLARQLGLTIAFRGEIRRDDVILVEDGRILEKQGNRILSAVRRGSTALAMPLKPGEYRFGDEIVHADACGMEPVHFVSRATGHPLVQDLRSGDVKFWYDERVGYVTPILHATLRTEGWREILTSGNGAWKKTWVARPAAVEKCFGKGVLRLCQVDLPHRLKTNPVARILAGRLLGLDPCEKP